MKVRRPVIAALVAASSLVAMAVPAGASTSTTVRQKNKDWTVIELPCATGHKHATVGYSPTHPYWLPQDDNVPGVVNPHGWLSWADNPCKGQWLVFDLWEGDVSEDSNDLVSLDTGISGHFPGATFASLADVPICQVEGADRTVISKDPNAETRACAAIDNA